MTPPRTGRPLGRRTGTAATVSWTGRIPAELMEAIRADAERLDVTVTSWLVGAAWMRLRERPSAVEAPEVG